MILGKMPRTYVPNPRGIMHRQHNVEELENALTIIASGKSIRSVSRDLNIPFSVLQRFHKNRQQNPHFVPKKLEVRLVYQKGWKKL